ncbi:MAG: TonB family protein, partial [Rhodothermales bacterium]|nr:TonB family protein [Rhodothermales bacterium]
MRYLLAAMLLACSGCAAPQATTDILGSGTIERVDPETGRVTLEKLPILIGGLQELQKSIRYPETAKQERRQGVVRLQVIVDEAGAPEEITVLQSAG